MGGKWCRYGIGGVFKVGVRGKRVSGLIMQLSMDHWHITLHIAKACFYAGILKELIVGLYRDLCT